MVIMGEAKGPHSHVVAVLKALCDTAPSKLFPRLTLHRFEVLMKEACLESGLTCRINTATAPRETASARVDAQL